MQPKNVDKPGERLSQQDFARRIGLSYRTVSRVFNAPDSVQRATREKVLAAARKLGFRHHPAARALKLQRTMMVGLIGDNEPLRYWSVVLGELERALREAGYYLVVCHRPPGRHDSTDEIGFLIDRQADAYVLIPGSREGKASLRALEAEGKPVLVFDRRVKGFPFHYLGTDSRTGARRLAEHLLALGHRRLAFAGPIGEYTARQRLAGVRDALHASPVRRASLELLETEGWSQAEGEQCGERLLAMRPRPTAILAANDTLATGIHLALRAAAIELPRDCSLTGYAGEESGRLLAPALTTAIQPAEPLGRRAAQILLEAMAGTLLEPVEEEMEDRIEIRASTASLATEPKGRASSFAPAPHAPADRKA